MVTCLLCACMFMCVCTYVHTCVCMYVCLCVGVGMYRCTYVCIYGDVLMVKNRPVDMQF